MFLFIFLHYFIDNCLPFVCFLFCFICLFTLPCSFFLDLVQSSVGLPGLIFSQVIFFSPIFHFSFSVLVHFYCFIFQGVFLNFNLLNILFCFLKMCGYYIFFISKSSSLIIDLFLSILFLFYVFIVF